MLTLPSAPELKQRLQEEAQKHGLPAPEYALRLLEGSLEEPPAQNQTQEERAAWLTLSQQRLAQAYGNNEPEYAPEHLREINPEYVGR